MWQAPYNPIVSGWRRCAGCHLPPSSLPLRPVCAKLFYNHSTKSKVSWSQNTPWSLSTGLIGDDRLKVSYNSGGALEFSMSQLRSRGIPTQVRCTISTDGFPRTWLAILQALIVERFRKKTRQGFESRWRRLAICVSILDPKSGSPDKWKGRPWGANPCGGKYTGDDIKNIFDSSNWENDNFLMSRCNISLLRGPGQFKNRWEGPHTCSYLSGTSMTPDLRPSIKLASQILLKFLHNLLF